jgi:hypothetical protein
MEGASFVQIQTACWRMVKTLTSWVPTFLTEGMIATEMPEARSPYSIAAAPDWSFRKRRIWFNMGCLCLYYLPPEARFNSKSGMVNKSKPRLTMNGKTVTMRCAKARSGVLAEIDMVMQQGCTSATCSQIFQAGLSIVSGLLLIGLRISIFSSGHWRRREMLRRAVDPSD